MSDKLENCPYCGGEMRNGFDNPADGDCVSCPYMTERYCGNCGFMPPHNDPDGTKHNALVRRLKAGDAAVKKLQEMEAMNNG